MANKTSLDYMQKNNINKAWDTIICYCINDDAYKLINFDINRSCHAMGTANIEYDIYDSDYDIDDKITTKYKTYKLKDMQGNVITVTKDELKRAILLDQVCVLNMTLTDGQKLVKRRCIFVESMDDLNKCIEDRSISGLIGNSEIGFFNIQYSYHLRDYIGNMETVKLPKILSKIDYSTFSFNKYTRNIVIQSNYRWIESFGYKSNIENIYLEHDPDQLLKLTLQNTNLEDNILNSKNTYTQIHIPKCNLNLSASEFINIMENKSDMCNTARLYRNKIDKNDKLHEYILKSNLLGCKDVQINLLERKLQRYLINKHINKIVLPPVKWLNFNCFSVTEKGRVNILELPITLEDTELDIYYIPHITRYEYDAENDRYESRLETRVNKIIIPDACKIKFITKANDVIIKNRLGENTPDKLMADIKQTGLEIIVKDTTEHLGGTRYIISDRLGNIKIVNHKTLLDAVVDGKVKLLNATLYVDKSIRINK